MRLEEELAKEVQLPMFEQPNTGMLSMSGGYGSQVAPPFLFIQPKSLQCRKAQHHDKFSNQMNWYGASACQKHRSSMQDLSHRL